MQSKHCARKAKQPIIQYMQSTDCAWKAKLPLMQRMQLTHSAWKAKLPKMQRMTAQHAKNNTFTTCMKTWMQTTYTHRPQRHKATWHNAIVSRGNCCQFCGSRCRKHVGSPMRFLITLWLQMSSWGLASPNVTNHHATLATKCMRAKQNRKWMSEITNPPKPPGHEQTQDSITHYRLHCQA